MNEQCDRLKRAVVDPLAAPLLDMFVSCVFGGGLSLGAAWSARRFAICKRLGANHNVRKKWLSSITGYPCGRGNSTTSDA